MDARSLPPGPHHVDADPSEVEPDGPGVPDGCAVCGGPGTSIPCWRCGAVYHRACRIEAGGCVTAGCEGGRPRLGPSRQAEANRSPLQVNVAPVLVGFVVLLVGLLFVGELALAPALVAGAVAQRTWG